MVMSRIRKSYTCTIRLSYKKNQPGPTDYSFSLLPLPSLDSVAVTVPMGTQRRESAMLQEEMHL